MCILFGLDICSIASTGPVCFNQGKKIVKDFISNL